MHEHIQSNIVTWRTGLLFIKRSYSSQLDIPAVIVLPNHRRLMGSTNMLPIKAQFFVAPIKLLCYLYQFIMFTLPKQVETVYTKGSKKCRIHTENG